MDILGIGQENLISIPVKGDYRMDIATIDGLAEKRLPILAVIDGS